MRIFRAVGARDGEPLLVVHRCVARVAEMLLVERPELHVDVRPVLLVGGADRVAGGLPFGFYARAWIDAHTGRVCNGRGAA